MDDIKTVTGQDGAIEMPARQTPWYEQPMSLGDIRSCISASFQSVKRAFVAIGFYLKKADQDGIYLEDGYQSIWEFAKNEYGLSQSAASRYMSICSKFSVGGNSPNLQERYRDFDKSKLQEMLSLTDDQLEQVTPDMRVEDIRAMKPGREKKTYDIPYFELEGQLDFDTSIPEIFPRPLAATVPEEIPPLQQTESFISDVSDLFPKEEGESIAISQQTQAAIPGECRHRPGYPCALTLQQQTEPGAEGQCGSGCCWDCAKHGDCNIECYSSAQRPGMDYDVRRQYCKAAARKLIEAKHDWMLKDYENRVLLVDESEKQLKELLLKGVYYTWHFPDPYSAGVAHVNFFPDYIQFFNGDCGGWVGDCSWFYLCAAIQSTWNEMALERAMKGSSGTNTVEPEIESAEVQEQGKPDREVIDADFTEVDGVEDESLTDLQIAQHELDRANSLLNKCLKDLPDENNIHIRGMKIKVAALASYVCDLDDIENPPPKPEQPELPQLRNNDQRAAFVDAYQAWPLWIETKETGERYYRYDLEDGTSMVVKVYHARLFDYSKTDLPWEERYVEGYGRHEYYLIRPGKFFKDCEANRPALIDKLKEIQRVKKG